jgi:hypothetical protein
MSEGLIHTHNRISQAQKMRMLNKQTLCKPQTKYTQKAEERYTKQTKERVYKDKRRRNIEQCRGFIMGCYRNMEQ